MQYIQPLINFFMWLLTLQIPVGNLVFSVRDLIIFGVIAGLALRVLSWLFRGEN